jgi:hypothetical protein
MLAKSRGDLDGATRSFERAIDIGRTHKRSVVRWTQELESLQQ